MAVGLPFGETDPLLGARLGDDVEVGLGRAVVALEELARQAGEVEVRHRRVVEAEEDLEQRIARQLAVGLQLLDDLLEGNVLVRVRVERRPAHPADQLAKHGIAFDRRAEDDGVDHHPDHRLDLAQPPVRNAASEKDVVLAGVAVDQGVKAGEDMKSVTPSLRAPSAHRRDPADRNAGPPAEAVRFRPRPVRRQLQHRRASRQGRPSSPACSITGPCSHCRCQSAKSAYWIGGSCRGDGRPAWKAV